ncbi:GDP-L-fucose synthase [Methanosarcina sp. 2.H.T.1A.6]|uniref:GDP-L-fucose synthase n=1 Tax=unclassified Methanosarcina TaxID=2644672 RepID=UPI0006223974|nr:MULTISPECIES: GDP-L-fucose synthase [unclassified Methanosarcina]KKG14062.1 GDP-L-fucose synthase [Methanosarcina sp. 2.H.T.1A.15]KKG14902.1 GDP-L-fucose synthase [Methanosarcina sp. 2.H.T.1A.3]KKG21028.1 GDP-L-fucose synthase [Methanosarcina sp. 2.H.T.1A.6]KKG27277.1 GDP-L-fucose synthase [Methanosarcina sp. 2.H.T.1A.8]
MEKDSKIYLAGHRGLVGSALKRKLESKGYTNLLFRTHKELDLTNQHSVNEFFERENPEYVFLAAAKVGGILANSTYPAQFIYENLMIEANVIHAAYRYGVKKLLFLGSSCIYPKLAPQPLKEEYLLTGTLEETNEAYAIAKIAGIRLCKHYNQQYGTNFISVMPTNLYGPNDNFDLETSHVMPALIRKFHEARSNNEPEVVVWGTGKPLREFMHVDDMADACVYLMENYDFSEIGEFVNIGVGEDVTINELVELIKEVVGFEGKINYDTSKPDGTPRKLMDVTKLNGLGWKARISLKKGIERTYEWYIQSKL